MRVVYLANIPSPYRVDFFNELGKHCDLTVLFERRGAVDRNSQWLTNKPENFRSVYLEGFSIGNDSAFCPGIIKWLKWGLFDIFVIGVYSTPTSILAIETLKLKGIPFFLNADGGFIKKDRKIVKLIKQHLISSAKWWLSSGEITEKYLLNYGAKKESIYSYPFTSLKEVDIFKSPATSKEKDKLKEKLGLHYDTLTISIGQFIPRKGFDILINAWSKFQESNIGLVLIGEGEDYNRYYELIKDKNLRNIKILDFKKKTELFEYLRCADVFIFPTREDIWGLVINEAMACGLPIISTNKSIAALELVINEKNGYIVLPDNPEELSSKLKELLYDQEKIKEFSRNSLSYIKQYTIERMAERHNEIFHLVIDKK